MNPRWVLYLSTTDAPTNHGFMCWISEQLAAWCAETGTPRWESKTAAEHDAFTAWLTERCRPERPGKIQGPPVATTCQACRRGDHSDHQAGVWRRADGSDPVLCVCRFCNWYRCGVCGEGCKDFPAIEHAGRCFPAREPEPVIEQQLALDFAGASS